MGDAVEEWVGGAGLFSVAGARNGGGEETVCVCVVCLYMCVYISLYLVCGGMLFPVA
jgi:hypothetical protein